MALIALIDLDEPLDARADAALQRTLRESGVARVIAPADAASVDRGDRVLLVGATTLLEGDMVVAMAEGAATTLACLPNELDNTQYELIDGATRWAGWAALPGDMVAETAQGLAPEWSLASTLVRRAVQHGALRVDATRPGALIALDAPDAVAAIDQSRLRAAMRPRPGISGRLVERAALMIAELLLAVPQNLRWAGGAAVVLFAGFAASLYYGWLSFTGLTLILVIVVARVLRGLSLVAARPLPWLDRATNALALVALTGMAWWTWRVSGQWGVAPLAIVLAADTNMAGEDEAMADEPLWWRGDAPAYAAILAIGALLGAPVGALVVGTVYASVSFAVARRRLRSKLQRADIST